MHASILSSRGVWPGSEFGQVSHMMAPKVDVSRSHARYAL